jgi:hypothetical protein
MDNASPSAMRSADRPPGQELDMVSKFAAMRWRFPRSAGGCFFGIGPTAGHLRHRSGFYLNLNENSHFEAAA